MFCFLVIRFKGFEKILSGHLNSDTDKTLHWYGSKWSLMKILIILLKTMQNYATFSQNMPKYDKGWIRIFFVNQNPAYGIHGLSRPVRIGVGR